VGAEGQTPANHDVDDRGLKTHMTVGFLAARNSRGTVNGTLAHIYILRWGGWKAVAPTGARKS
jgi:hypothetical protein